MDTCDNQEDKYSLIRNIPNKYLKDIIEPARNRLESEYRQLNPKREESRLHLRPNQLEANNAHRLWGMLIWRMSVLGGLIYTIIMIISILSILGIMIFANLK